MPQKNLLTLPLRFYVGLTKLTYTTTVRTLKVAAQAVGLGGPGASAGPSPSEARNGASPSEARSRTTQTVSPARPRTTQPTRRRSTAVQSEPTPTPPPPAASAPVPDPDTTPLTPLTDSDAAAKTIEDTDEVIAEFADPGGEDGAGATLTVDPPWEGYDGQNATTVVGRLGELGAAEVALVELYERGHKNRRTVLTAAARRLKTLNQPG